MATDSDHLRGVGPKPVMHCTTEMCMGLEWDSQWEWDIGNPMYSVLAASFSCRRGR